MALAKCKSCREPKIRLRNGIKTHSLCTECRKIKELELREKNKANKEKLKEEKLSKAQRKLERKLSTKKYQKSKFKSLHKKAWGLISKYVRQQGADEFGMNECYTCSERKHWKEMHCSHYFHNKLDFDLRNLKACCEQCNFWKSGHLAPYGVRLAKELGVEGMEKLRLDANTTTYTIEDLEKIIQQYS
jgi:hypothetical protein